MNGRGRIRLKFSDSLVKNFIPEGILRGTGAGRGPVMKDGRTFTGIVHGTLSNDFSMVTWFHFIEKTS